MHDDSEVTVMITNKDLNSSENAVIDLKNADKTYKSAAVYAVYGDTEEIRLIYLPYPLAVANQFSLRFKAVDSNAHLRGKWHSKAVPP